MSELMNDSRTDGSIFVNFDIREVFRILSSLVTFHLIERFLLPFYTGAKVRQEISTVAWRWRLQPRRQTFSRAKILFLNFVSFLINTCEKFVLGKLEKSCFKELFCTLINITVSLISTPLSVFILSFLDVILSL